MTGQDRLDYGVLVDEHCGREIVYDESEVVTSICVFFRRSQFDGS